MLIRLLRPYLGRYRRLIVLVVLLQLIQTLASLYLPTLNAEIIDRGVVAGDTALIVRLGGVMLAVTLVQVAGSIGAVYFGSRAAMGSGRDIRRALFDRVQSFSAREVGRFGTPSLITRTTNDVQQVQMVTMMGFTMMVSAPIMCIGGVVMSIRQDVHLSALLIVIVPALAIVLSLIVRPMRPLFRQMQVRLDQLNRVLREQIIGVRVIRAFVQDNREQQRFEESNTELMQVQLGVGRLTTLMFPAIVLIINASSIAVIWFAAGRVDSGAMQIGALTAFLAYLMQILMSVMMANFMLMMVPRAEVCAVRINEVLDTETSVVAPASPTPIPLATGRLTLEHVGFSYPGADEPILSNVSLDAVPGEMTAIIGSTGSGKSTLLNVALRLVDATEGAVRIDGVDVRQLDQSTLSRTMSFVPQKPYLFTGTVATNLRYGNPDATDEELWHALEVAQAHSFVEAMPEGLAAPISQGGTNVSGGQRQRLAIARALVAQPLIYLFDDSFSALDYATDAALRRALVAETRKATVVIVAQRVNTIRNADRIIVLEGGRIVGSGTHENLMSDNATYREIVLSQLTEQEAS